MNDPLVTIYVTTKNRISLLRRALDSVLAQTYRNLEIIVCDDGSDVDVGRCLAGDYPDIKFIRNEISLGACASRNLCIRAGSGEFVTGLDDDDYFLPDRIEKFIKGWDAKYSFFCTNIFNENSSGIKIPLYFCLKRKFSVRDLMLRNEATSQIFTLRSRLLEIGGFDVSVKKLQDWDAWLRLSHKFGDFYRYWLPTYVMVDNPAIERVSNAQSYIDALSGLLSRNIDIYDVKSKRIILNQLSLLDGKYSAKQAYRDIRDGGSLRYLYKYLKNKLM